MSPEAAGEQACAMEHCLTNEAMSRMVSFFELLGTCPAMLELLQCCPVGADPEDGRGRTVPKLQDCCDACTRRSKPGPVSVADVKPGQSATVTHIVATGVQRQRLLDMGILPETTIDVERSGIGRDRIWIRCQGARLALRRAEARAIRVRREN